MLLLAESYEKGLGVPKDSKVWRSWLLRAVEQGDARIQFLAGESFERVAATPADLAEAARCYSLAAEQGQRDAINALKRLKQQEQ